ncbi:hypothetical protein D9M71_715060 [compost metagenome]
MAPNLFPHRVSKDIYGTLLILSVPPATIKFASSAFICWKASATERIPDAHCLLIVIAGIDVGNPAFSAACLAGFALPPA